LADTLEILKSRKAANLATIQEHRDKIDILISENKKLTQLIEDIEEFIPPESLGTTSETNTSVDGEIDIAPSTTQDGILLEASQPIPKDDLASCSAYDAAQRILEECPGEYLNYTEIAERAVARGYKSQQAAEDIDSVADYLLDVMRRLPHKFVRHDRWYFRLANEADYKVGETTVSRYRHRDGHETRAAIAERMMRELNRPLSTAEIADEVAKGEGKGAINRKLLFNSIYNAMVRSPLFVRVGRGWWGLAGKSYPEQLELLQ
jgi:hypothetical protein